jgi:hypothetical protein
MVLTFKMKIFISIFILTISLITNASDTNLNARDSSTENRKDLISDILDKMEIAVDPNQRAEEVKTLRTVMDITIPSENILLKVTVFDKFPDKTKLIQELPNGMRTVKVLNGESAWERVEPAGKTRIITGKELDFMKFELFMKTPGVKLKQIFKTVEIESKNEIVGEHECYKLKCIPSGDLELPPITLFVDKSDFLTRRMDLLLPMPQGAIIIKNKILKYEVINGRNVPSNIEIIQGNATILKKLISVDENIEIPDTEFENSKESDKTDTK